VPHTIEEAYEVAEAALCADDEKLVDELGDLLFQVVFLAALLEERDSGSLEQVVRGVHAKLIRRHPHVFGDVTLDSPDEVRASWEAIKVSQEGREGIFHDIPGTLPGLLRARKVQRRAAAVGFDYPDERSASAGLDEELSELRAASRAVRLSEESSEPDPHVFAEVGDSLFALVSVARKVDVDPELSVIAASRRFSERIESAVRLAELDGHEFEALSLSEQDDYFRTARRGKDEASE